MIEVSAGGECLFVCVVGPGFDSTSPSFERSISVAHAHRGTYRFHTYVCIQLHFQ